MGVAIVTPQRTTAKSATAEVADLTFISFLQNKTVRITCLIDFPFLCSCLEIQTERLFAVLS
jgi:hypothetical protein